MSQKKSWGEFYQNAGDAKYFLDHLSIHKEFLVEILNRKSSTILEAGCGSAIMSIFLAMTGRKCVACDRDDQVLSSAKQTAAQWNAVLEFSNQDLLNLNFKPKHFDLAFSQGVLEHMTDEQIRQSCREILRVSQAFIFSVPSHHYRHQDFGDERLLNPEQWKRILEGIGNLEIRPYFYLRVKRNFLIRRPLMLMGILTQ